MLTLLRKQHGCKIANNFMGVFGYASLLSLELKEMLNTCEQYASDFDITFNFSKSNLMCFSKSPSSINLNNILYIKDGCSIENVQEWKHLAKLFSDISCKNIYSAINDLFMRTNSLTCDVFFTHGSTLWQLHT